MMPRLNASGFVACLRLEPHLASIPILIVTASYAAHEAAERLGAGACLTKPFALEELVAAVDRLVARPAQVIDANALSTTPIPATLQPSLAAET
jgi:DNA-binding response OmpR family regulator